MAKYFTQVFHDLNNKAGGSLFDIVGECITPLNERVGLAVADSLSKLSPLELAAFAKLDAADRKKRLCRPFVGAYPDPSRKATGALVKSYAHARVLIQSLTTADAPTAASRRVTEELGTLVSTLYLRGEGYAVGGEGKYGSVDDVVAWKSPVLDELRGFGFVEQGCTLRELACLRWLPRLRGCDTSTHADGSLQAVEVERSSSEGLSCSERKGLNQLLGALRERVATGLYLCFPVSDESTNALSVIRSAIDARCGSSPRVGSILFDDKGLHVTSSETMPTESAKRSSEIARLDKQLMTSLLANFHFGEIIEFARRLGTDFDNRNFRDVGANLLSEIADKASSLQIIEELDQVSRRKP